ncbi:ABC transporter permease subunit [Actinomyces bowdenii]|uniref:ABC transporter permease n=1 Tax=Actinomyces bowdenii TaxID=131109 RepID=A0A3P1V5B4_9ACTO|nr:ABC transporter permease subunit [Actinomyces bowdenii]RRD29311.1 ABC transporter permease [Actinomyces bowdenii]
MTTTTASPALTTAQAARPSRSLRRPAITGRQTFARAIAAEWAKIRSLSSTWITSSITVAITVLFGAGLAIAMSTSPETQAGAAEAVTSGATFGQIAVAVLAALTVTGEYSSGQIRSSLAAVPHRGRLLVAKAITVGTMAFALGLISTALSWAISAPFMDGHAGSLADAEYLGLFWGTGLAFALIALMSLGTGFLLRSTAGTITVMTVLLFVIDIPVRLMTMKWEWAVKVVEILPSAASLSVSDPLEYTSRWAQASVDHPVVLAAFLAWTLVPLALGWLAFSRRDA